MAAEQMYKAGKRVETIRRNGFHIVKIYLNGKVVWRGMLLLRMEQLEAMAADGSAVLGHFLSSAVRAVPAPRTNALAAGSVAGMAGAGAVTAGRMASRPRLGQLAHPRPQAHGDGCTGAAAVRGIETGIAVNERHRSNNRTRAQLGQMKAAHCIAAGMYRETADMGRETGFRTLSQNNFRYGIEPTAADISALKASVSERVRAKTNAARFFQTPVPPCVRAAVSLSAHAVLKMPVCLSARSNTAIRPGGSAALQETQAAAALNDTVVLSAAAVLSSLTDDGKPWAVLEGSVLYIHRARSVKEIFAGLEVK